MCFYAALTVQENQQLRAPSIHFRRFHSDARQALAGDNTFKSSTISVYISEMWHCTALHCIVHLENDQTSIYLELNCMARTHMCRISNPTLE